MKLTKKLIKKVTPQYKKEIDNIMGELDEIIKSFENTFEKLFVVERNAIKDIESHTDEYVDVDDITDFIYEDIRNNLAYDIKDAIDDFRNFRK